MDTLCAAVKSNFIFSLLLNCPSACEWSSASFKSFLFLFQTNVIGKATNWYTWISLFCFVNTGIWSKIWPGLHHHKILNQNSCITCLYCAISFKTSFKDHEVIFRYQNQYHKELLHVLMSAMTDVDDRHLLTSLTFPIELYRGSLLMRRSPFET